MAASTAAEIELVGRALGRRATAADLELGTFMLAQIGRRKTAVELEYCAHTVHLAGRAYARWAQGYDALLTPTLGTPPLPIGALAQKPAEIFAMQALRLFPITAAMNKVLDQIADSAFEFAGFTAVANLFGLAAMSVPLHWSEAGLPIGVQFIGGPSGEGALLRLAGQLERARPWAQRRPAIAAAAPPKA